MSWLQLGKILGQAVIIIAAIASAVDTIARGEK